MKYHQLQNYFLRLKELHAHCFRNEYYLAYFLFNKNVCLNRERTKKNNLESFETSRLNSTGNFSRSETAYVMFRCTAVRYIRICIVVAP